MLWASDYLREPIAVSNLTLEESVILLEFKYHFFIEILKGQKIHTREQYMLEKLLFWQNLWEEELIIIY